MGTKLRALGPCPWPGKEIHKAREWEDPPGVLKQTPEILRRQNPRHSDGWDGMAGKMSRMMSKSLIWRPLECKSRKSRNTWSNREIWPWSTKWSRAKANRVLPREGTGHSKHPLPTTQEMTLHMDITRWSTPKSDWLYSLQPKMETLYTVSKNKTRSWLWLRSWTPYWQIQTWIEEK